MEKNDLRLKLILFFGIVAVLLTADLLVKELVFRTLAGKPAVVFIPGFWSWHYTANDDTGFSLFRTIGVDKLLDKTAKLVVIVSFQLAGVAVAAYFFWSRKNYLNSWVKRLPLALIISGGLGNALDRIIRGFVVDYVLWYFQDPSKFYWPIFNLADTYTVVGVGFLAVFILFTKSGKEEKKPAPTAGADESGEGTTGSGPKA